MRTFFDLRITHIASLLCLVALASGRVHADASVAESIPESSMEFMQSNCIDCHDGSSGEGGFDVSLLSPRLDSLQSFESWVRIYDRVQKGEMPPPEDVEIEPSELAEFLPATERALQRASKLHRARDGRVQGRRLTNMQLQRTLQDLLKIDYPLASLMPAETRNSGYVNLADAQTMSHFQLQSHLTLVDTALDAAFDRATLPNAQWAIDYGPKRIANKPPGRRNREPELRQGLAVTWSSGMVFYGRISSTKVPESGTYRIIVTASAVKPPKAAKGNVGNVSPPGLWCSVRSGECVSSAPLMTWIGDFRATSDPKTMTYEAWIPKGHMIEIRPADATIKKALFQGGQVGYGEGEKQDVPGVALHRLRMERIHPGGDSESVRQQLFHQTSLRFDKKLKRTVPEIEGLSDVKIQQRLADLIVRFAELAFRRPTTDDVLEPFVDFTKSAWRESLEAGESREQAYVAALRAGYRAVLCSPRFLYLCEYTDADGRLDDWSVASRLSYFICGSMPDETLRRAADSGQLRTPAQLRQQTDRLLKSPRGRSFVEEFSAQWLDLVDIDFTEPDRRLFRDFDIVVQDGMLAETHTFLQYLLDENLPIRKLIDADFTFLDERLARYYEIETPRDVDGNPLDDATRMVPLESDWHRGGLLSHGSILKVTANGNDTSPVLRGIWVCERVLGEEIPPPPSNVPAVEPDIRGATTIRELLAKHESDASCAACHKNFDPPGFALENFDAGGKWRDHYRQLRGGKYQRGPAVDASYRMVDGHEFQTFEEFRSLIAADEKCLAANFATQLLTYATGAKIQFADRPVVDAIVAEAKKSDYGIRSILHAVVASNTFLQK
ncbi:DUF1592 domain-containing protein [Rhodopirellula sp. ICT_H3.1]|uniref:DUF1592 domain-containing protein n=2 Tax=Aporhodopirellula aestuarii TaxID=2950107 RepID=A0ABT0TY71_9BACT|nr:DUF1592 domain-containing protein [Aporhodopirellula aestuarii]